VPGYEVRGCNGIGAPKNTPAEIIDMLNKEINYARADEGEVYEAMTCPACTWVHLVNPATGKVLGADGD
jgi:hypothetical protein